MNDGQRLECQTHEQGDEAQHMDEGRAKKKKVVRILVVKDWVRWSTINMKSIAIYPQTNNKVNFKWLI